ncbi:Fc.00g001140.m01.CDS01 [Cosmosporella sp. VM-42]
MFILNQILDEPRFAAYTELYAGFSPEISMEQNGGYGIPWGRIRSDNDCPRKDIIKAMTPEDEGGLAYTLKFWEWCEKQWQAFI